MTYLKLINFLFENHKEIIEFDDLFSEDIRNLKKSQNINEDFELLELKIKLFKPSISVYTVLEDSNERDYYIINFKMEDGSCLEAQLNVCKDNNIELHYTFKSKFMENDFFYDFLNENFFVSIDNKLFDNERIQYVSDTLGFDYKITSLIFYTDITRIGIKHNKEEKTFILSFSKENNRIMINNSSFFDENYLIDNKTFVENIKELKELFELNLEF